MESFEKLGVSPELVKIVTELGFTQPSEIQEKVIPLALQGKDIIGGSATGSGKTLAFSASILENLQPGEYVQALILTPTRELANQVSDAIKQFSKYKDLNVAAIYGGVGIEPQVKQIAHADIVVATPGRLLDHFEKRSIRLDHIKFLVLDEVDRMFDMGFYEDVERIIRECPKERQTMLFSATISHDLDHLAQRHTKNAVTIEVESRVDPSKLKQVYYDIDNNLKFSLLMHLLQNEDADLVMVFCSTRRNVDFVARNLSRQGIEAHAIHGGLSQNQRNKVLKDFHGKGVSVLVCTDVAARGLDIKDVSHVYNYDLPNVAEDYIHRIGRTARAGENGKAISLLSNRDYENFERIIRLDKVKVTLEETPYLKKVEFHIPQKNRRFSGQQRNNDYNTRRTNRSPQRGRNNNQGRNNNRSNRNSDSRNNSPRSKNTNNRQRRNSYNRR